MVDDSAAMMALKMDSIRVGNSDEKLAVWMAGTMVANVVDMKVLLTVELTANELVK